ncbi:transposase [Colwellia psychrerythraea]|uniref:Transposase n=1 Tax=Colwellia psychrerythraea TaxID=28229 RepID=A0A1Y5EJM2_COLPS|nr:transposase [Colwellia psychrerythraea]
MPIRKIPKNYSNVTGIAAHSKATGQAMFESTLERDFLMLLEFDKNVDSFEVQPVKLQWLNDLNKNRSYTPDVLVYYKKNRPTLFEVKYRSDINKNWEVLKPKFKAAIRFCKENGWKFKLITEVEIRTAYLESVKFLLPFVRQGASNEDDMMILDDKLIELKTTTPKELISSIYSDEWNQAALLPTLWYLIGSRQIQIDLTPKITMSSKIWKR